MPEYVSWDDLADLNWEDLENIQWQHLSSDGANWTDNGGITNGLPKDTSRSFTGATSAIDRDFDSTVASVSR